jgi:hypothetical protein
MPVGNRQERSLSDWNLHLQSALASPRRAWARTSTGRRKADQTPPIRGTSLVHSQIAEAAHPWLWLHARVVGCIDRPPFGRSFGASKFLPPIILRVHPPANAIDRPLFHGTPLSQAPLVRAGTCAVREGSALERPASYQVSGCGQKVNQNQDLVFTKWKNWRI